MIFQLVLTVDHHINWVFWDVCTSHHHAGESSLVSELGLSKQQAGVFSHAHAALVVVSGDDCNILVELPDQKVS